MALKKASIAFEDDESMAFLDRYPIDMGHCLLVPKKHYERITDMSSADVGSIFSKVPKLASIILQKLELVRLVLDKIMAGKQNRS